MSRIKTIIVCLALLGCAAFLVSCLPIPSKVIRPARTLPSTTPWDLKSLSAPPKFRWGSQAGPVWSLYYDGLPYKGQPTEVFAYYADPLTVGKTTDTKTQFPAIVLVHGGGGQAFSEWAKMWADRGYAAIAMDLQGNGEGKKRLPNGGPEQTHPNIFATIDEPYENQWPYHAVANVILAHSLMLSFEHVDAWRTAVTGISWGGYLTCIVAGLDNRFKAAVPVYGCGYLDPDSVWRGEFEKLTAAQRKKWLRLWDPSRYVGSATMPMFFVNGTNDFAYWLESYKKTYDRVRSPKNYRIAVRMGHGHIQGWERPEIGLFVDQYLMGTSPLPVIEMPKVVDGRIEATVKTKTKIKSAQLNYTEDSAADPEKRKWVSRDMRVDADHLAGDAPPAGAKIWFITATDDRDAIVSSELVFAKP